MDTLGNVNVQKLRSARQVIAKLFDVPAENLAFDALPQDGGTTVHGIAAQGLQDKRGAVEQALSAAFGTQVKAEFTPGGSLKGVSLPGKDVQAATEIITALDEGAQARLAGAIKNFKSRSGESSLGY